MNIKELSQTLLGKDYSSVEGEIKEKFSGFLVRTIPNDYGVTLEYNSDRINFHLDSDGKIKKVTIG